MSSPKGDATLSKAADASQKVTEKHLGVDSIGTVTPLTIYPSTNIIIANIDSSKDKKPTIMAELRINEVQRPGMHTNSPGYEKIVESDTNSALIK